MSDAIVEKFTAAVTAAAKAVKAVCDLEGDRFAGNAVKSEYKEALSAAKVAIDAVSEIKGELSEMRRSMGKKAWMESGIGAATRDAEETAYTDAFPGDAAWGSKADYVQTQILAYMR